MSVLLVTYDLRKPGRNYELVWDYLKRFNYCKGLESVWFLDTAVAPEQVRDAMLKLLDDDDRLFVGKIRAAIG